MVKVLGFRIKVSSSVIYSMVFPWGYEEHATAWFLKSIYQSLRDNSSQVLAAGGCLTDETDIKVEIVHKNWYFY